MSREFGAVMLADLSDIIGKPFPTQAATFADMDIDVLVRVEEIGRVHAAGVMGAINDNYFRPRQGLTREQGIIALLRFYEWMRA